MERNMTKTENNNKEKKHIWLITLPVPFNNISVSFIQLVLVSFLYYDDDQDVYMMQCRAWEWS